MSILRLAATKRLLAIARLQNFRFPVSLADARLCVYAAGDSVLPVEHCNLWPMCRCFFGGQARETHNGKEMADFSQVRRCSIQLDHAFSGRAIYDVGLEAFTVLKIADKNPLVSQQSYCLRNVSGDGETAFVIQTRAGHSCPMDFGF